jgi:hypothetical protein
LKLETGNSGLLIVAGVLDQSKKIAWPYGLILPCTLEGVSRTADSSCFQKCPHYQLTELLTHYGEMVEIWAVRLIATQSVGRAAIRRLAVFNASQKVGGTWHNLSV